jgi:hypothetical protein
MEERVYQGHMATRAFDVAVLEASGVAALVWLALYGRHKRLTSSMASVRLNTPRDAYIQLIAQVK